MAEGGEPGIEVAELERLLKAADPAVLMVSPRILRRVIKHDRNLGFLGLLIPHRKTYVIAGAKLAEVLDPDELGLNPWGTLPPTALLIARPDPDKLATLTRNEALVRFWRRLFHARVHLEIARRLEEPGDPAATVRERIGRIGQAEFDEARAVLRHEDFLLPPRDDRTTFEEFAAVYLELRHFADQLLPRYFPAIEDYDRIDSILAEDLNAPALLAATRPAGAPDPFAARPDDEDEEEGEPEWPEDVPTRAAGPYRRLMKRAEAASSLGNVVRSAILQTQAVRLAPHGSIKRTRAGARDQLDQLARRLRRALKLDDQQADAWRRALSPLLEVAARGVWPVEARLLYDLQKVCIDHEREVYAVDLVEWVRSLGRRPIRRRLPHLREVLISKHLRSAARRLRAARLSDRQRDRLTALLREAVERAELALRERFRPVLAETFQQTGIQPRNLPERVALRKLIEELLDSIVEQGYLRVGDLRDALSRSHLKLPDLAGPTEFLQGDRLLQTDHRLALALDSVYHRAEIYLRWLQRLSSLAFGTRLGRFLTRYVVLPFGGAFIILKGLEHLIELFGVPLAPERPHLRDLIQEHGRAYAQQAMTAFRQANLVYWRVLSIADLLLGTFLLGLLYVPWFRQGVGAALRATLHGLRLVLVEGPAWLLDRPLVRRVLRSRVFLQAWRWVLKPVALTAIGWRILPTRHVSPQGAILGVPALYLVVSLTLNTRLGRNLEEITAERLVRSWQLLRSGILPGLYRSIMEVSDRVLETIDRVLYTVDEWLRFRSGQGRGALVAKATLGLVWFLITYVVRFVVNLLIEPQVNPIKHFPVVTVSHKLLVPFSPEFYRFMKAQFGPREARAITGATFLLAPGMFGFLVWELKENWKLYEANRSATLKPDIVGHHGETVLRFMKPGLHSGTLPKLFAKLRRDERRRHRFLSGRKAFRKHLEALHHVESDLRAFVERDLVAYLSESTFLRPLKIEAGEIQVATNRIQFELFSRARPGSSLRIGFEEQSGWLVAGIVEPGWLSSLSEPRRRALATALAGFYKMAGVGLVREQIRASFEPGSPPPYDIAEAGLVVWPSPDSQAEAVYDLRNGPLLSPSPRGPAGTGSFSLPTLNADQLIFRNVPITWRLWVSIWEADQAGLNHPEPLSASVHLLPPTPLPTS